MFELITNVIKWYFHSLIIGMDAQTLGCVFFHTIAVLMVVAYTTQKDRHFRLVLGLGAYIFMASSVFTIGCYLIFPIFSSGTGWERIIAFLTSLVVEFILAYMIYFKIVDKHQPAI